MTIKNKRKKRIYSYHLNTNFTIKEPSFFKRLKFLFLGGLYMKYGLEIKYKGKLESISATCSNVSFKKIVS